MKKLIPLSLICLLLLGVSNVQAQTEEQPVSFNFHYGVAGYNGDLGNDMLEVSGEDTDVTYGVGLGFYLNDAFDLALNFNLLQLDKTNLYNDDVFAQRGTEFKTNVKNLNLMVRWKFLSSDRLHPYIAAGIGGSHIQINEGGYFDNPDTPVNEANPGTPVDPNQLLFTVPLGVGINFDISSTLSLNFQAVFNQTFVDGLDNFPTSNAEEKDGFGNPPIDNNDNDEWLTTTVGISFNFGGEDPESYEERLLKQSLENLEAAENSSDQASETLEQAQELNEETLAALEELRSDMGDMSSGDGDDLKAEMVRIVNNVQFEFDRSDIIEPAMDELNSLVNIMQEYDRLSIDIAARADERGSDSYNEDLSMRRAQAVKDYLVDQGVSASRISTSALGENDPLMSGNSETAYAQNRSVQLTLSYNGN